MRTLCNYSLAVFKFHLTFTCTINAVWAAGKCDEKYVHIFPSAESLFLVDVASITGEGGKSGWKYRMSHLSRHPQLFHIMRPLKSRSDSNNKHGETFFFFPPSYSEVSIHRNAVIYRFCVLSLDVTFSFVRLLCWCLNRNNNKMMPQSWLPVFDFMNEFFFISFRSPRILIEVGREHLFVSWWRLTMSEAGSSMIYGDPIKCMKHRRSDN